MLKIFLRGLYYWSRSICCKLIAGPHDWETEIYGGGHQVRPLIFSLALSMLLFAAVISTNREHCGVHDLQKHCPHGDRVFEKAPDDQECARSGQQVLEMSSKLAEELLRWLTAIFSAFGLKNSLEWIAVNSTAAARSEGVSR
jgi:hypothetical protein